MTVQEFGRREYLEIGLQIQYTEGKFGWA